MQFVSMANVNVDEAADLVTETDRAVEVMITESLKSKYPDVEYDNGGNDVLCRMSAWLTFS